MTQKTNGKGKGEEGETVKKAIITGITGQDGSYLAEFLLEKVCQSHVECFRCYDCMQVQIFACNRVWTQPHVQSITSAMYDWPVHCVHVHFIRGWFF